MNDIKLETFQGKVPDTVHGASGSAAPTVYHRCTQDDCTYKTRLKGDLQRHLANIHEIGVVWHHCDTCSYKAKQKSHVTQHRANVHGIGVVWHACPQPDCTYRSKV